MICRSFGNQNDFDGCGRRFSDGVAFDYAQDALKVLDGVLYSAGTTGGRDSFGNRTVGPSSPSQQLVLLHMTDAEFWKNGNDTALKQPSASDAGLGNYFYSNRFKNERNAVIVGIGIELTNSQPQSRRELGAIASKGGSGTSYDSEHSTLASTQEFDRGAPRLTGFSSNFEENVILSVTSAALDATTPACVAIGKKSEKGTGTFVFSNGTNGLPQSLSLATTTANPQLSAGFNITSAGAAATIRESIPSGWALSSVACVDSGNVAVPGTSVDLKSGLLTIPANQLTAGRKLTCTFTNTALTVDLSVTKQALPPSVQTNGTVFYKLTVSNAGPEAADGAVLRDSLGAGLNCSVPPTCIGRNAAVCPSAANLSIAALTGSSGLTIPTLPSGGAIDVTLQCLVTASGIP